ncbi:MAG: aminotransferase IV [Woeseiaceae bacterium]|jgi:branched-chain amino acid aminotransferase group I|nr:aminotransferase IV [Woeseiaceae bacterium]|tara:strand:- start:1003 stop:1920 length:918 start_codon:yes stop_codon:yes gene_type:complete
MQTPDPRNKNIFVFIDNQLVHRDDAKISVFDSAVQGGDAVWEGLRVYKGRIAALDDHLQRLQNSAKTLAFEKIPSNQDIKNAIFKTLEKNNMWDESHIRLTLTRGKKTTSGMNPKLNQFGCTLIVLAEWKPPIYDNIGISVITSSIRRNTPQCLDSKIHHNNLLNNILAMIEANVAGVDSAVMLDVHGLISETNDTNIFLVKGGSLITPFADSCLPGLTRAMILEIAVTEAISAEEKNLSITDLYTADEAFTTGTMGELTPILKADGRIIGDGKAGPITKKMQQLHRDFAYRNGNELPFKNPLEN